MKSIETRFAEAMDALKKAGRVKKYDEVAKTCTTTESKLHAAEAVLKDAGVVREAQPIKKHNGSVDTFVEGNPFGRTAEEFSPGYTKDAKSITAKSDQLLFDGLLKVGGISEAEHRKLTGCKPEGYDKLSETQRKEFDFARAVGISEADSFKLAKMAGSTLKEVSRR